MHVLLLLAAAPLSGCGPGGPTVVHVSGTVTHQDKPVPNLFLNFKPMQGRPSWGVTDENGRYELKYSRQQDGAVPGTHKVWVSQKARDPAEEMRLLAGEDPADALAEIMRKYGSEQSSPLEVEVTRQRRQVIDLALD